MNKFFTTTAVLAILVGIVMGGVGIWGICFTYQSVSQENIITPDDAAFPKIPVRGPISLKAQADAIRAHVLESTNGKTYAEMPRQIAEIDAGGNTVMVPNKARDQWITATALTTALHLGIFAYVFSGLVTLLGIISLWTGLVFLFIRKRIA